MSLIRTVLKGVSFVFSCLILCSCPASHYTQYKLLGSYNNNSAEYEKIVLDKSDTVFVKVGVLHSFIDDKKTYVIVKFKELPNTDVYIFSKKHGALQSDNKYQNIFRKEIKSIKKGDTVIISNGKNSFYFSEK